MVNTTRTRLTDRLLTALKPPRHGRLNITDTIAPGLTIRIAPTGTKIWAVRYRPKGLAQRRATIGTWPGMKLDDARSKAHAIAAAAKRGQDLPATEAAAQEQDRRAAARPGTLRELVARYIADYVKVAQRKHRQTERLFEIHVIPKLGDKLLTELRRADVVELLDDMRAAKLAAQVNRVRSQVIAVLNWAVEREFIAGNPAVAVKRIRGVERPRERILTDAELRVVWKAADAIGYPGGTIVKLLILTGTRRDEVRGMRRDELREDGAVWLLPASRNKEKRDHLVPLPQAARDLLEAGDVPNTGAFVFSVNGRKPYNGVKRLKQILDRLSGVKGWVFHDFRRTLRTRLGEMGFAREVAERVLNHAKPGIEKVYDVGDYRDAVAKALEAWAQRVDRVVAGESNVVELARVQASGAHA